MTAHTPGPWRAGLADEFLAYGNDTDTRLVWADSVMVADCRIHWKAKEEGDANARLIAAAPDILDCLKAYNQWEADLIMCDKSWDGGLPTMTQELYDRFIELQGIRNKAVKKAEGR